MLILKMTVVSKYKFILNIFTFVVFLFSGEGVMKNI